MANLPYISQFLSKVEGACQTQGYIPCHKKPSGTANYRGGANPHLYTAMGASGVTIATGCDLGQTSYQTMVEYGLAPAIAELFRYYYGKKKDLAIAALHQRPLIITQAQAEATDMAVHKGYLDRYVRPAFESASGRRFDALPDQAQAVIMSVCFQKGCGGVRKGCPRLWSYLINAEWSRAATELCTGFSEYVSRRRQEGRLLAQLDGTEAA